MVNLGPHHPSTHGVFRMLTRVEGETILALEPEMGYLHRNHEKIGERNTWLMNMPFTDRLDYLNSMSNNWAYALAVEKLAGIEVPERAEYLRVIMAEFTRIVNHVVDRVHPERPGRPADAGAVRHRRAGDDPGPVRGGVGRAHDVQLHALRRRGARSAGGLARAGPPTWPTSGCRGRWTSWTAS